MGFKIRGLIHSTRYPYLSFLVERGYLLLILPLRCLHLKDSTSLARHDRLLPISLSCRRSLLSMLAGNAMGCEDKPAVPMGEQRGSRHYPTGQRWIVLEASHRRWREHRHGGRSRSSDWPLGAGQRKQFLATFRAAGRLAGHDRTRRRSCDCSCADSERWLADMGFGG